MVVKCPTYEGGRDKADWTPSERTLIERRAAQYRAVEAAALQTSVHLDSVADQRFAQDEARRIWTSTIGQLIHLRPEQASGIQGFLANQFGIMNRNLGINPQLRYSTPGEVRYALIRAKSSAEGMLNAAGRMIAVARVDDFNNAWRQAATNLKLKRRDSERLFLDTLELGRVPHLMGNYIQYQTRDLGQTTLAEVFQRRRYSAYVQRMTEVGFTRDQMTALVEQSTVVHDSFNAVSTIARAMGVDVGEVENLDYFARQVTRDFRLRYEDINAENLLDSLDSGIGDFSTMHNRSRSTNYFIPEDMAIVSRILGVKPSEIREQVLGDPRAWARYLHDNVSTDQLDLLVDSGVMQKLPMTSVEVMDYFVSQYSLPYDIPSQMYVTDPAQVVQNYTQSLQRAAGNSAMLRRMVEGQAITQGWAITRQQVRGNADFASFVPLGSRMDRWAQQAGIRIPTSPGTPNAPQAQRQSAEAIDDALGLSHGTTAQLGDMYVHPVVADSFQALITISTDPKMMGTVGQTIYYMQRFFGRQILANPRYVSNTIMQGIQASFAAGSSLFTHVPAFLQMQRLVTHGLESFDSMPGRFIVRKNGDTMSARQLMEYFLVTTGHSVAPGSNMIRVESPASRAAMAEMIMQAPENVGRAMHNMVSYAMASGDPVNGRHIPMYRRPFRAARMAAMGVDEMLNANFAPYAFAANFIDLTFKWSAMLSLLENSNPTRFGMDVMGQVMTSGQARRFDDVDEAVRHINEYFYNPYNLGRTTAFVNNYVRPFAAWSMANPSMQIRHMLRNPQTYMAFNRLRSFWSTPMTADEDYNSDNVPDWISSTDPIYLGRDQDGDPILMVPTSWDAGGDFLGWINQGTTDTARVFFNRRVGSAEQVREYDRNHSESFESWLTENAGQLHTFWRVGIETVTGRDWTGRSFIPQDDLDVDPLFLGVNFPPRIINIMRKFPLLEELDRVNPGGRFGRPTVTNAQGEVIQTETPSWFRGLPASRVSSRNLDNLGNSWAVQGMRLAGLNVRTIDYDRNSQNTLADVEHTIRTLETSINEATVLVLSRSLTPEVAARYEEEIAEKIRLRTQYMIDHARVLQWMRDNDVLPINVLREMNTLGIQIRDTPLPGQAEIDRIIEEGVEQQFRLTPAE